MGDAAVPRHRTLQLILIAAVIQGWSLYGLSWSADHFAGPAKDSGLLIALYALVTVAPLTLQFLVEHSSQRLTWYLTAAVGLCFAALGWHFGHNVSNQPGTAFFRHEDVHAHLITAIVLWLLVMPLLQSRLITGHWRPDYKIGFAQCWRNLLTAAEAALFTGLFWGLLYLCDALFRMLGVTFFGELYREEIFSIPVTWLTFGIALFLIGGMDQLTTVMLRQILGVLKWLAVPAMLIVAFFTVALLLSLPGLVGTGRRAISAGTLLWIAAIVVLLLNAAYRDGETDQPYPRFISAALRLLVPLTLVIAVTAMLNLGVRTNEYGLTVDRAWGWVVALTAVALTAGYSVCAIRKGVWMRGMDRVNVVVMVALIAVLLLTLTPVLSPYRLTANSQDRILRAGQPEGSTDRVKWRNDILRELRFDAGGYGKDKLRALAADKSLPKDVTEEALLALSQTYNGYRASDASMRDILAQLPVFPKGRTLPADLAKAIEDTNRSRGGLHTSDLAGLFLDLTGDEREDFVLLGETRGFLFEQVDNTWQYTAHLTPRALCTPSKQKLIGDLEAGRFATHVPRIAELAVGLRRFVATPESCVREGEP